jgi:hypothetical protein
MSHNVELVMFWARWARVNIKLSRISPLHLLASGDIPQEELHGQQKERTNQRYLLWPLGWPRGAY